MKTWFFLLVTACLSGVLMPMASSQAAVLISDNFDDVTVGGSIHGRNPVINTINSNTWVAPATNFLGNASGSLNAVTPANQSIALDLGSDFLSTPGIYQLSLDIMQPSVNAQAWVGFGFATGVNTEQNLVANNGAPWMLMRLNGAVNVYGGGGVNNQRVGTTTTAGVPHTFMLQLDTTGTQWKLDFFIDGTAVDLDTTTAGNSYLYTTNPTTSRYLTVATGTNTGGGTGTIDNLVFANVIPEPSRALLAGLGFLVLCLGRSRKRE